jgi:hypothetical protein
MRFASEKRVICLPFSPIFLKTFTFFDILKENTMISRKIVIISLL